MHLTFESRSSIRKRFTYAVFIVAALAGIAMRAGHAAARPAAPAFAAHTTDGPRQDSARP